MKRIVCRWVPHTLTEHQNRSAQISEIYIQHCISVRTIYGALCYTD